MDRTIQKKTKLLMILLTVTVLWSLILNSFELALLSSTNCKSYTEMVEIAYVSFGLVVVLKVLCISFFNLELAFKQPYTPSLRLLYPFVCHCIAALLQLPQNVFDFTTCLGANKIIDISSSWYYLEAVIASLVAISLYFGIRKGMNPAAITSRLCGCIDRFAQVLMVMSGIAWNIIFIVVFGGQKDVFLPSLFFDFYLYLVLGVSMGLMYRAKKRFGEKKLTEVFIKVEKESIPLSRENSSPVHMEIVKVQIND